MHRRQTLKLLGGGFLVAAGAGTAFVLTREPARALAPWRLAGTDAYDEPSLRALSYAILAPNPHNRQPWLVDLAQPGTIRLLADRTRLLPHTDPFNRQITIGLGCFLELLAMAAAENGYRATIVPFPEGSDQTALDDRAVATVQFVKDRTVPKDPLFRHVLDRRSLKEPFDTARPVGDDALVGLAQAGAVLGVETGATNRQADVALWRGLTREAMDIELKTSRTFKESVDLFRIGKREIEANPDGIHFSGPLFETLALAGVFTRERALDPASMGYQEGYRAVMSNIDTAMGYVWLTTRNNSRIAQIAAGRSWLRVNLAATAAGLGVQPLSQILQEYPEIASLYRRCHTLLTPNGGTVQMLARVGHGPAVAPSPRWEIVRKLKTA